MKKIYLLFTLLFTCFISVNMLKAVCEEEANNISYDLIYTDNEEEGLKIQTIIYDIDENLYIKVSNDYNDDIVTYNSSNINEYGYIIYDSPNVFDYVNYTVDIYSNDETCSNRVLRTIKYKTSKYNPYSVNDVCYGEESEILLCGSFYDIQNMSEEEFINKVLESKFDKSFLGYVKKYYIYVLIPFVLGLLIFLVRVFIFKRGNKNA